jgi:prepilin peptidase CpaA
MEVVQGFATAAASVAAVIDVRSRRIPNWVTGSAFIVGVLLNAWLAGLSGAGTADAWLYGLGGAGAAIAGAALGGLILLPFYLMRVMGAGDVKLLAALGALLGPQLLVSVAVYGAIGGGVMSAIILLVRGRLGVSLHEIFVEHRPPTRSGATAPYALAIASGMYLSLVLPQVLR